MEETIVFTLHEIIHPENSSTVFNTKHKKIKSLIFNVKLLLNNMVTKVFHEDNRLSKIIS
jgi:hypothetical protein